MLRGPGADSGESLASAGRFVRESPIMETMPEREDPWLGASEDMLEMKRRVARLETGIRLVVETLRRVHADLSGALSGLREEVVLTATSVDVRRIVTEGLQPLEAALQSLVGVQGSGPEPGASESELSKSDGTSESMADGEGDLSADRPQALDASAANRPSS